MKYVTIIDIAKELGISKSTVSRALAGDSHNVNAETMRRIVEVADRMGYQRNELAVNLRRQHTQTIGILIPEVVTTFFMNFIEHAQRLLRKDGYRVIVAISNEDPEQERENLRMMEQCRVDGVLMSVCHHEANIDCYQRMIRKGIPFSLENLEAEIHDLAGIRVICSYVDDIYALAEALTSQDDITLVERKDYISSPKPNGYRSLHLIVSVPVFFSQQTRQIGVEVQIRTIAMDFWASLEHQMKYKREIPDQQHIVAQLKSCADDIARVDQEMMNIRLRLEASADEPSEDDLLIARLKKLDTPIL